MPCQLLQNKKCETKNRSIIFNAKQFDRFSSFFLFPASLNLLEHFGLISNPTFIPKVPKTFEEMPGEINFSIHDEYTGVPIEESDEIQEEGDPDDFNPEKEAKDDNETDENEIKETINHQENSDEPIESAETNSHNNEADDNVVGDDDNNHDKWSLW